MIQQFSHVASKILITGRSGSGKTTLFLRILAASKASKRFIFDGEGELSHKTGIGRCFNTHQLKTALLGRDILFDPSRMYPGDTAAAWRFFCEWAFEASRRLPGTKLLAVDELQKITDSHDNPWEWSLVLETGRRAGLDVLAIAQQANLIHNRVRTQMTEVSTFGQSDKNAIAWLADIGFDAQSVRDLRPGKFIARNLLTMEEELGQVF